MVVRQRTGPDWTPPRTPDTFRPMAAKKPARDDPDPPAEPSFEDAIEQVESIIERIERGEQGLERSITDYERGAGLLKRCREILARSEQRIQEIEADLSAAQSGGPDAPAKRGKAASPSSKASPPPTDEDDDTPF